VGQRDTPVIFAQVYKKGEDMSKKRGRPEKEIDDELVRTLASYDCSYEEIAAACKCDPSTLTRRFKF